MSKTGQFCPDRDLLDAVRLSSQNKSGTACVELPYVIATPTSMLDFGEMAADFEKTPVHILQWPNSRAVVGGTGAGVAQAQLEFRWSNKSCICVTNNDPSQEFSVGWKEGSSAYAKQVCCHPDSSKLFFSTGGPFIAILSNNRDEGRLKPTDFVAFYFDGTKSVIIPPGMWHFAAFPLHEGITVFTKQGNVQATLLADFSKEFGVSLRIPKAFSEPKSSNKIPAAMLSPSETPTACIRKKDNKSEKMALPESVPLEMITENNFEPYGVLVCPAKLVEESEIAVEPWPGGTRRQLAEKNQAGLAMRHFSVEWNRPDEREQQELEDLVVIREGRWKPAGCVFARPYYALDKLQCRPDGAHFIFARKAASFLLAVASNCPDFQQPIPTTLRAFRILPNQAVIVAANVWHSYPIPLHHTQQIAFIEKFCAVDARIEFEFGEEGLNPVHIVSAGKEAEEEEEEEDSWNSPLEEP